MSDQAMAFYVQPQWFLPSFAVLWLVVTGVIAHLGGWAPLLRIVRKAQLLPACEPPMPNRRY